MLSVTSSVKAGDMTNQYRHRAEALLRDPPLIGAMGPLRRAVVELQREAEAALIDADARLRSAARDRLDAVERLERCQRALLGTGQIVDPGTGMRRQYLRRRRAGIDDPVDTGDVGVVLAGEELRNALVDLLEIIGEPLSVRELHRLLVAHGVGVGGRASQSISGALRVEVSRGRVERVGWGEYRAASMRRG
jgi:hypothetical protein